jgi:hypothetical protein
MALTARHERHLLREHVMKSRITVEGASTRNAVRALVATLCVLGLVGLTLFGFDDGGFANRFAGASLPEPTLSVENSGFLRAPTSDPSLPSLEGTFSRKDVTPVDAPPAPTF